VTKSGTKIIHGSLYEYNRSNIGQANDWFNEHAQVAAGEPNKPGPLVRNTYGAWVGGADQERCLFFFGGFEGQRTNEGIQTTRTIPSDNLRQGKMQYPCSTAPTNAGPPMDPNCTFRLTRISPSRLATHIWVRITSRDSAPSGPHAARYGRRRIWNLHRQRDVPPWEVAPIQTLRISMAGIPARFSINILIRIATL